MTVVQAGGKLYVGRLGIAVGLAMLLLAALFSVSASGTAAVAPAAIGREAGVVSNGAVITIGVGAVLSGPADFIGWPQANGVQLAISQTNAAGGIAVGGVTYTLALVVADSGCNPVQAITAAQTLLDAGVAAVVGHSCSGATAAAQGLYYAAGVPMVSASSTRLDLTEQGYTTTFRVVARDDAAAVLMATHLRQWLGMDQVALVDWGGFEWSTGAFSSTFASLGGAITSRHTVTSTDDYTATLTAIQPEDPDVVFYADPDPNNAGLLSSVAQNLGLSVVAWDTIWGDQVNLGAYAAAAGAAAEGDYAGMTQRLAEDMPGYEAFNLAYQAAGFANYGGEAGLFGAYAYDAARIIIAAIDAADSADPAAVRDAIAATVDHVGVVGTYLGFDAKGDVIPQWSWLARYQSGRWVTVYPTNVLLPLVLRN